MPEETSSCSVECSEMWFNRLYAHAMGTSHRHKECEFAIYAPVVKITIVRLKT